MPTTFVGLVGEGPVVRVLEPAGPERRRDDLGVVGEVQVAREHALPLRPAVRLPASRWRVARRGSSPAWRQSCF